MNLIENIKLFWNELPEGESVAPLKFLTALKLAAVGGGLEGLLASFLYRIVFPWFEKELSLSFCSSQTFAAPANHSLLGGLVGGALGAAVMCLLSIARVSSNRVIKLVCDFAMLILGGGILLVVHLFSSDPMRFAITAEWLGYLLLGGIAATASTVIVRYPSVQKTNVVWGTLIPSLLGVTGYTLIGIIEKLGITIWFEEPYPTCRRLMLFTCTFAYLFTIYSTLILGMRSSPSRIIRA